jgi:type IV pilus assembly protein PilB
MVRASGKIRRILVDAGLVTGDDWSAARDSGRPVVDVLIESDKVSENQLYATLGAAACVPPVDLTRVKPDPAAVESLPQEVCTEHLVLPVARNGDLLTIAVSDPFDVLLFDDLNILSSCKVRPVLSHPAAIRRALDELYDSGQQQVDDLIGEVRSGELQIREQEEEAEDLDLASITTGDEMPAVKLANLILLRALKERASDIHIEPEETQTRVRYRIDGRLKEIMTPPKGIHQALISRIKILASLDIAIRHEPQDGKFQIRFEGRTIDFRLSTLPVVDGEKAVMRILDQSAVAGSLNTMGFEPLCLQHVSDAVGSAYGMMLVTGPTGSGKSTTLYACVKEVSNPELNIVTVEDPVEYRMPGINQVPVNPKRGMTFAGALRSILRQDPDVVLVGEIRDTETAEIAVKAALTGHLVLSTLHTNDAVGAVTRLIDMGVDSFMVASSVLCVAAQRLVRKLCAHCRMPIDVPHRELLSVGFTEEDLEDIELFGPRRDGCPRCSQGYSGRMALLETFYLDSDLKRMVVEGRSVHELKAEGLRQGMITLRRAGIANVLCGKTSLEEVLRVTMSD